MSENQEEKAYEVDESGEVKETAGAEEASHEHEHAHEELPEVDVYSMLGYFIGLLSTQVWQWLGLTKSPSGKLIKDLAQAKVAIDSMAALSEQLEGKLAPKEQQELKDMLANMRINFVQQSAKE
jgi:hypothetical protein